MLQSTTRLGLLFRVMFLLSSCLIWPQQTPPVQAALPVPIIIDTDIYGGVDDVGALAVVNALMTKGEADLLGVVVDTRSRYSAYCADAINTYFGHPDIPIAINYPITGDHGASPDWVYPCAAFPEDLQFATTIPTALSLYRQQLAGQADRGANNVFYYNWIGLQKDGVSSLRNGTGAVYSHVGGLRFITGNRIRN